MERQRALNNRKIDKKEFFGYAEMNELLMEN